CIARTAPRCRTIRGRAGPSRRDARGAARSPMPPLLCRVKPAVRERPAVRPSPPPCARRSRTLLGRRLIEPREQTRLCAAIGAGKGQARDRRTDDWACGAETRLGLWRFGADAVCDEVQED